MKVDIPTKNMIGTNNSVVFIVGSLGIGGAEKQLFILCRELLENGWKVSIINLAPEMNPYWKKPLSRLDIKIFNLARSSNLNRIISIIKLLKAISPRVVHGWHFYTNLYANICGFCAGVPLRIGSIQENPDYWFENPIGRFFCLIGLSKIMVNSNIAINVVKRTYPNKLLPDLYLIRNGIATSEQPDYKYDQRNEFSLKWAINKNVPWICALGRQDVNKNWGTLLRAAQKALEIVPFIIIFIGAGQENNALKKLTYVLGIAEFIKFVGEYPEAENLVGMFDLLCLTSKSEGIPNVLLEAGKMAIPVISSNVGGVSEFIKNGESGYLISADDFEGLSKYIVLLLENEKRRKELGAALQKIVHSEFSISQMVNKVLELYS